MFDNRYKQIVAERGTIDDERCRCGGMRQICEPAVAVMIFTCGL